MNKKKDFSTINPALAFINTQHDVQENVHDNAPLNPHDNAPLNPYDNAQLPVSTDAHADVYNAASEAEQYQAQSNTQHPARRTVLTSPNYIRTQGRKGKRKPRINLAFDSVEFLDSIRKQAEYEDKSITQLVNEACALYLKRKEKGSPLRQS